MSDIMADKMAAKMAAKMADKMAEKKKTATGEPWKNYGREIYDVETTKDDSYGNKSKMGLTAGAIKKASLQWYKMKWQFTASANELWGEEAQGFAQNVEATPLGACSLFRGGALSQVRIRFFNLLRGDDASNDFRCAFLKFGDGEEEGPFDLAFTTGRVSCYDSVSSLQQFLTAMDGDDDSVRDWALYQPTNYYALVDGLRRFPRCWSDLDYYNHATYTLDIAGETKLVRFRLHGNRDAESRLTRQEQEDAWIIGRPDIELPSDTYLHDNMNSLAERNMRTRLQVQIRDPPAGDEDPRDVISPTTYWDDEKFPWQDLSDIVMTYCVPKVDTERAKYTFTIQHEDIRMETPTGTDNFGGMVHIREKVLTSTTRRKRPEKTPKKKEKTTTFLIHVETGSCLFAGTDAGVYMSLYGTKGRTKKVLLDKLFHDDFERGSKEAYYITVPVIGDIQYVKVFLIGGKYTLCREWFLSNVVIFDLSTRKLCEIPVYRWVLDKLTLPAGSATLSQNETNVDKRFLRRLYLEEQDKVIPWGRVPGLPGKIGYATYDELPLDLKFASERDWQKKYIITDVLLKLKLHQYSTAFTSFDSFDEFKAMSDVIPNSETSRKFKENEAWRTDEEFGRQVLCGINPVMLCGMTEPLEKFPVTNEMVGKFLDRGMSLSDEMKAGHIYYIDYQHLKHIPRTSEPTPKYMADPLVMFYVRSSGELVPIAIQLEQEPGKGNPIWTPADTEMDWLLAKMWVKSTDSHYQALYTHLLRVHLVMEALTVAALRKLPCNHPVYKLLMPHSRYTVAVAQKGRDVLVGGGESSVFDKILAISGQNLGKFMASRFKCFTYDELIPPRDFSTRGVSDSKMLPGYRYRDDAMLLWNKVLEFVSRIMSLFYKTNSDVSGDTDLQAFVKDVHDNALPSYGSKPNGVPDKLETIPEMVEFVAMFMFQSSVYHAAINYGQADYFTFGPNYPSGLRKPPPKKRGETALADIIDTLPNKSDQATAIAFSVFLSEPLADEVYLPDNTDNNYFTETSAREIQDWFSDTLVYLPDNTDNYFTETSAREILDWFSDELGDISRVIEERNTDTYIPYSYMLPERIPKSAGQ